MPPYTNTAVPRTAGIRAESGNDGALYPTHSWIISDQIRTGTVNRTLSQNLSRNIATLWPACLS
jgi:hypothetical protein